MLQFSVDIGVGYISVFHVIKIRMGCENVFHMFCID